MTDLLRRVAAERGHVPADAGTPTSGAIPDPRGPMPWHAGPVEPGTVTPRERDVLELLGDQLTYEEIGRRLFVSPRTVETHVASLRRKLLLPDHRALVRFAVEQCAAPRAGADALPPVPL